MTPVVDAIAGFVHELTWADVPQRVRHHARLTLRDAVGNMIAGSQLPSARITAAVAERESGPAAVVCRSFRTTRSMAALANGNAANSLDLDDGHYACDNHPSSVIVPTLLALACEEDRPIEDLLVAQIAAYEVALRAAYLLHEMSSPGEHASTALTVGAAAGGAKLLGFDADVIARAIGTAWVHAPMAPNQMTMSKEVAGWGAATGVTAVDLAAAGYLKVPSGARGPLTIFDRPGCQEDPFVSSLGIAWESGNTFLKPFSACRWIHAAGGALRQIVADEHLDHADIEAVEVAVPRTVIPAMAATAPCSLQEAQFSFPFVLSALALYGQALSQEITEPELADPKHLDYCERISVVTNSAIDKQRHAALPAHVTVRTTDGRTFTALRTSAPGDPADPMTDDELRTKFLTLVTPLFGARDTAGLADDLLLGSSVTTRGINHCIARTVPPDE